MKELSAAMAAAFSEIEGAVKGKTNPAFRSKYADLAAVTDAIKPALAKHGLWYRQVFHEAQGGAAVETVIHHASGEFLSCGTIFVPATKPDAQGLGSAATYARRYSLMAAFGVPAEDDDGNAAVRAADKPAASPREAEIRKAADKAIELHAKATVLLKRDGDTSGFWALYEAVQEIQGDDRMALWAMLAQHPPVRAAINEYTELARKEAVRAADKPAASPREAEIRKAADKAIELHAKATVLLERDGDTSGFWALYEAVQEIQGDDRMALWAMLAQHPPVRAAIKEYAELARKEKAA